MSKKLETEQFKVARQRRAILFKKSEREFLMQIRDRAGEIVEAIPFHGSEKEARELFESYIDEHSIY